MSDFDLQDFKISTPAEAKAFAKWFLRTSVDEVVEEFPCDEDRAIFLERRDLRMAAELDELNGLKWDSPIEIPHYEKQFCRIVKKVYKNPLSIEASLIKSSRFNYKNISELQNRVLYFGQDVQCCIGELFHLDIQKYNYSKIIQRSEQDAEYEFKFAPHLIYDYSIDLKKVLVITTDAAHKALGITDRVTKNEWFSLNDEFAIPSAGQILGAIARRRGYQGLLFTSVRTQTTSNLVVFEENTGPLEFRLMNQRDFEPSQFVLSS